MIPDAYPKPAKLNKASEQSIQSIRKHAHLQEKSRTFGVEVDKPRKWHLSVDYTFLN